MKELEKQLNKTSNYSNSIEFTEESNELLKEFIKKDYMYNIWAFSEFRNNR
tara:strand:+ start:326 stop:478 length:153 start_codon:yes stop_codon:yes gene_type:complete